MNKVESYPTRLIWFMALLFGALVAGCNGGQDPVLGAAVDALLAPEVIDVTPADDATDVPLDTVVTATFNEPVALTGGGSFTVTCDAPCTSPGGAVTFDGTNTIATFTPDAILEPLTVYTATVTAAESLATGLAMVSPFVWTFTTADTPPAPPIVTAVSPEDEATGVPINITQIIAEFSEPVAPIAGAASFTVTCEAPCASPAGSVSLDATSTIATFELDPGVLLEPLTVYTGTVTAAESLATGLTMTSPFVWTFTTSLTADLTRPRVTVTAPLTTDPGPTPDVPSNTAITATFTEDMDPSTIDDASFTVTCVAPCVSPVDGIVSYSVGSRTATFDPPADLEVGETYTATITTAATDLAANELAGNQAPLPAASDYVWTFTTTAPVAPAPVSVLSTIPDDGAIDVCPNASISATFDVPSGLGMDPNTVSALTFTVVETLVPANAVIAASVTLDGTGLIATFTPQDDLTPGLTYTATIAGGPTGVTDLANPPNEMAADFEWSFTVVPATGACLAPPDMGTATPFAIAATAGVTNTPTAPTTTINGDVVLDPTATCNAVVVDNAGGFGLCGGSPPTINGQVITNTFPDTTTSATVKADLNAAFLEITPVAGPPAAGSSEPGIPIAAPTTLGDVAGSPLVLGDNLFTPGIYTSTTSILITGDITLDALGDPNAVFIFQSASTLDTAAGAISPGAHTRILLINGASASNVWWQVASSATLGLQTEFQGNILAAFDITMGTGSTSCGRLMSGAWVGGSGAFVFDSNVVSVPGNGCPP